MIWYILFGLSADAQVPVASQERGTTVETERMGGNMGVGLALGAPTGVTVHNWLDSWSSVHATFGGNLGVPGDWKVAADYLIHFRPFSVEGDDYSVPIHIGAGFGLTSNAYDGVGDLLLGPRMIVGVNVQVRDLPIDLYVDTVPTLYIFETVTWSMDGQIGLRYYK